MEKHFNEMLPHAYLTKYLSMPADPDKFCKEDAWGWT